LRYCIQCATSPKLFKTLLARIKDPAFRAEHFESLS